MHHLLFIRALHVIHESEPTSTAQSESKRILITMFCFYTLEEKGKYLILKKNKETGNVKIN